MFVKFGHASVLCRLLELPDLWSKILCCQYMREDCSGGSNNVCGDRQSRVVVNVRCKRRYVPIFAVYQGNLIMQGYGCNVAGRRGMGIPGLASTCPMRIDWCTTHQVLLASLCDKQTYHRTICPTHKDQELAFDCVAACSFVAVARRDPLAAPCPCSFRYTRTAQCSPTSTFINATAIHPRMLLPFVLCSFGMRRSEERIRR